MKMERYFKKSWLSYGLLAGLLSFTSCSDYVEIDPPIDQLTAPAVFTDASSIRSAVTGLYSYTFTSSFLYYYGTEFYTGMAADEFYYRLNYYDELKNNAYNAKTSILTSIWPGPYKIIYQANDLIENLEATSLISDAEKLQYIAEAKFFRAWSHLLLVSFFGDVPLITTTKVSENALKPRTPKAEVFQKIIADLKDSETGLANSTNAKTRVTKWAASALLARTYLYAQDWANAESKASEVIAGGAFSLPTLANAFLRTSTETIFAASSDNSNTYYIGYPYLGALFNPSGTVVSYIVNNSLLNAFESGDNRKTSWLAFKTTDGVNTYYPNKYKNRTTPTDATKTEDLVVLRLGEQYLIRAEARANQNKLPTAISDLTSIRTRAGLTALSSTLTQEEVLRAVEHERQVELFVEGGHRWFDVTRTGRADAVFGELKPNYWKSAAALWPIPIAELEKNPNLVQNPGYN